jgi:Phosphotransferase system, mannose/fructose-specific component IIA
MIPILVCTHGESAAKLVESAEMIAGKQNECQTVKFKMGESLDLLKKDIVEHINKFDDSSNILCFVDLKGGTPFNVLVQLTKEYPNMDIITGVNIPMLMQTFIQRSLNVSKEELIRMSLDAGHKGIYRYEQVVSNGSNEEF